MTRKRPTGYDNYSFEKLLEDEYFLNWVLHPNADSDHFWHNWISRNPGKREQVELAREIIQSVGYKNTNKLPTEDYAIILERIISEQKPTGTWRNLRNSLQPYLKVAAVILVMAALSIFFLNRSEIFDEPPTIVVNTKYGQKRTIYLPDGTKVMLNSGSTIEYPEHFLGEDRPIKFSGEGFFEVTKNANSPFKISSGSIVTEIIGTSFNIKSFEEVKHQSIAVVTGKVKVSSKSGKHLILEPGDIGFYMLDSDELKKRSYDQEKVLAWKSDILWFDNESLTEVFNRLEKWYGVNIIIGEGVDITGHYTGKYSSKPLETILQGITFTSSLKYKIDHKTISIYE